MNSLLSQTMAKPVSNPIRKGVKTKHCLSSYLFIRLNEMMENLSNYSKPTQKILKKVT